MSDLERWEGRFAASEYVFGTEPNAFLKSQFPLLRAGARALALADGEGRNGVWLAQQGLMVTSVDFSPKAQEKARKLAQSRGVPIETQLSDLADWGWPENSFDVVAAIFIQFCAGAVRERLFAGIRRTLKSGGLLLMQGYRPQQLVYKTGGPSQIENLYTSDLLRQHFGDWELPQLREHDSVINEGTGHGGMSALIDLVARKPVAT